MGGWDGMGWSNEKTLSTRKNKMEDTWGDGMGSSNDKTSRYRRK